MNKASDVWTFDERLDHAARERLKGLVASAFLSDLEVAVSSYVGWMGGRLGTFLMQPPPDMSEDWVSKHARGLVLALGVGRALLWRIAEARREGATSIAMPSCDDEDVVRACGEFRASLFTVSLLLDETASEKEREVFASQRYLQHEALGPRGERLSAVARMVTEGAEQVRTAAVAGGTN